jgi:hypothetical protein
MNINATRTFAGCVAVAIVTVVAIVAPSALQSAPPGNDPGSDKTFSPYVSKTGDISRPTDYREKFLHLGSWAVAKKKNEPVYEMHNVYAPAEVLAAYRRDGKFPDGAALVKEITAVSADNLTTGNSSWSTDNKVWFVMIKDAKGRFPDNELWGDGWGWALFKSDEPAKNVATDYSTDCKSCHIPAKQDDWIYVRGYPVLGKQTARH